MVKRSGPYGGILHEVVEHNGVLYLAGIVSEDPKLDMAGQTRDVLKQLDAVLAAHGSDRKHLLTALLFITDMKLKPEMNRVWKEWMVAADLPTRATIGVADLDGYLLEAVFTAAVR
jgi:enamine deaminase RidA (YjgF/YER057c/UK114 family)